MAGSSRATSEGSGERAACGWAEDRRWRWRRSRWPPSVWAPCSCPAPPRQTITRQPRPDVCWRWFRPTSARPVALSTSSSRWEPSPWCATRTTSRSRSSAARRKERIRSSTCRRRRRRPRTRCTASSDRPGTSLRATASAQCEATHTYSFGPHQPTVGHDTCYFLTNVFAGDTHPVAIDWTYAPGSLYVQSYRSDGDAAALRAWWSDNAGPLQHAKTVGVPEGPSAVAATRAYNALLARLPTVVRSTCHRVSLADDAPPEVADARVWIDAAASCEDRATGIDSTFQHFVTSRGARRRIPARRRRPGSGYGSGDELELSRGGHLAARWRGRRPLYVRIHPDRRRQRLRHRLVVRVGRSQRPDLRDRRADRRRALHAGGVVASGRTGSGMSPAISGSVSRTPRVRAPRPRCGCVHPT